MSIAEVNGQRILYVEQGAGPPVVFSHGLFMDHTMFAPQVEALRNDHRVIAWDERGHGGTATDTLAPFSYYDSAADLAALLAHLGIEEAVLAGMSQGGFLSLRAALTRPQIARALILIDTQAGVEEPERLAGYMELMDDWHRRGALPESTSDVMQHVILQDGWEGAASWRRKWAGWKEANVRACMQCLATRDDITSRLTEIRVPTLIIHGDQDQAISLDLAQVLAERIPDAELVVIKGAGHAANLTHPEPVNAAIRGFLQRIDA